MKAYVALLAFGVVFFITMGPRAPTPTYDGPPSAAEMEKLLDVAQAHRTANLYNDKTPPADARKEIAKELRDTEAFCAAKSSFYATEFCSLTMGVNAVREYAAFREGAKTATWEETKDFQIRYMHYDKTADYFPPNNPTRWKQVVDALDDQDSAWGTWQHNVTRKRTSFRANRGTWHVERVGPFFHFGGDEWHHLWFDAFRHLRAPAPAHIGRWLKGSLMAAVTPDGEVIGYPPAHMHHFHLYNTNAQLPVAPFRHFLGTETHGDASCSQKGIGAICYLQQWPEGCGWPMAEDYFFDSLINFVVPAKNKQTGDPFYFQAAIYEADSAPSVGMPLPIFSGIDDFNPLQQPEAHTFRVPSTGQHVNWESQTVEFTSEFLGNKWHSHWYYTQDFWVIEATPEELGLNKAPFILDVVPCTSKDAWPYESKPVKTSAEDDDANHVDQGDDGKHSNPHCDVKNSPIPATEKLGELLALEKTGYDIDSMKQYVLDNLAATRAKTGKGRIYMQTGDPNTFITMVDGAPYWHRPRVHPGFTDLAAGSRLTVIGWYARSYHDPHASTMQTGAVRMHLKHVTFAMPTSSVIRWIMGGVYPNLFRWYKNHKPTVFAAVMIPTLALFALVIKKVCCKRKDGPAKLYNRAASDEDKAFEADRLAPL